MSEKHDQMQFYSIYHGQDSGNVELHRFMADGELVKMFRYDYRDIIGALTNALKKGRTTKVFGVRGDSFPHFPATGGVLDLSDLRVHVVREVSLPRIEDLVIFEDKETGAYAVLHGETSKQSLHYGIVGFSLLPGQQQAHIATLFRKWNVFFDALKADHPGKGAYNRAFVPDGMMAEPPTQPGVDYDRYSLMGALAEKIQPLDADYVDKKFLAPVFNKRVLRAAGEAQQRGRGA